MEFAGTSGNVFGNPRAVIDSSSTPYQTVLHSSPTISPECGRACDAEAPKDDRFFLVVVLQSLEELRSWIEHPTVASSNPFEIAKSVPKCYMRTPRKR